MWKPRQCNGLNRLNIPGFKWKRICRKEVLSHRNKVQEKIANDTKRRNRKELPPNVTLVSSNAGEFPSHKSTLSDASSYFRAMFGGSFQEASSCRIVLYSIASRTMQIIMNHIDLVQLEDERAFEESVRPVVVDVFRAAHMLDLPGLVKLSCTLLGESITRANYKKIWTLHDTCPTETLHDYLCASFRRNYRYFLEESVFLCFDPSLMKFVLGQSTPFVNHRLLVKMVLRWVKHDLKQREECLGELMRNVRVERLPRGYVCRLALKEKVLQRHPEVLEPFKKLSEQMGVECARLKTAVGYEVIADSISVLLFKDSKNHITTVERLYFSGRRENKALPFDIYYFFNKTFTCAQYKNLIYFVGRFGRIDILSRYAFVMYDVRNNAFEFLHARSPPIPANRYCDAFVVVDKIYVLCSDSSSSFVQCYDFKTGGAWTRVLNVPYHVSFCSYGDSFLTLQADGDTNATKVTEVRDDSSVTIACKFEEDVVVHFNRRLWAFSKTRKFAYDTNKKCFESEEEFCNRDAHFLRIHSLQCHPLIVKREKNVFTLWDFERGVELGRIVVKAYWTRAVMLAMPYCSDLTL